MSEGSLVVLKKNGSEGSKFPMEKENKYILGPGADCHLRFNVENYNKNICEISTNKKLATITKLSSCPILLNDNEIKTPKSLKYGDVIKIGPKIFKWSSLSSRESFTRNVFKNSSKSSASKGKRRSSLSDFPGLRKLNSWRETDENVQITSSEHHNVKRMSSSLTKSTKIEPKSSGKSKTVPKNYGTVNKTPKVLAVVKSLDFRTRSAGKKMSPAKRKYFDPNNKTSKIPRIFFPDHTKPTNKSPKTKTFEEFKENFKTPTTEPKKRKSTRISLELNSNAQIALTEANVKTPDSLGVKPETPNIKLVKSVNKKTASLKKSLDNITMAKKRKISNITTEDSIVSKKFKLEKNEESLIQDETMGSLFDSSLSFLESSISSNRSNRNSLPIVSSPISPKQFELHNVSGIKSLPRNIKSPVNFNSARKLSVKARQSLQLNSPKNKVVKRRFTESNLITYETPENEIRIIKPIFSTPKAQSSIIDLPIEEKVRKSVGRPVRNPKVSSLIKEIKVKRSPGRPRKSGVKTVLKSPKNILNLSGRKSVLRTPGSSLSSPKNKSIQEVIAKVTPSKQSPGRLRKSEIESVLQSPKNYILNVSGRKSMLGTPGSPLTSPKNKLIHEIFVKSTPGKQSPGRPRKSEIKTIFQSPKNSVLNVTGRKSLLSTPGSPMTSPKNKSIQEVIVKSTPGKKSIGRSRKSEIETVLKSPKNYVLKVSGRKSLLSTPVSPMTSPNNKSIQEVIVKSSPSKQSPSHPRKSDIETVLQSPKNYVLNVSGRKSLLSTPGSPLRSLNNKSIQEVIVKSTPSKQSPSHPSKSEIETVLQSPKNYVLNITGRKSLLSTPGSPLVKSTPGKSPGRPRKSLKSPKNISNLSGRKSILGTPVSPMTSPKNKSIQEVIGKVTPGKQSLGRSRKSEIETVLQSPENYVLNITGRKSLLSTPGSPLTSPKNKLIQEIIVKSTPGKQSPGRPRKSEIETIFQSPKNSVLNLSGRKSLLSTSDSPLTSPKNKLIQEIIVKSTPGKQSPGRLRKSEIETIFQSPKNSVLNLSGRKSLLSTPGSPLTSPKNKSIQEIIVKSTPGKQSPGRPRKSLKNISNVSEISILSTPGSPLTSPKNQSVEEIIVQRSSVRPKAPKRNPGRPPKSPKNDLTNVAGVKKLLKTPGRPPKSPKNDLTNVAGVKKLLGTPGRPPKSPKNDLTNIAGVKKLLKTPGRPPKSPKNDLTNIAGVKKLLGTPGRPPKSPKNDLTNVAGVKKLLKTPGRPPKSPKNDLTNIAGVKKLLGTPGRAPKSPKNDLNDIYGVKNLFTSPGRPRKSPKNDLSNVSGVKNLLRSPGRPPKSPKNELSNISGIKLMFASPEIQNSPRYELKNNSPLISIMKTPKNKLSDVSGIKSIVSTPQNTSAIRNDPGSVTVLHKTPERKTKTTRKQNQPKNDLSDVEGVASLFNTSKLNSPTNNMDSLFDHLKDENNDTLNLSFTINSKSPLRTYERKVKSLSPEKPKLFESRKSLREIPEDSKKKESVQKWLNEYVLNKEKSPENINIPVAKKSLLKELRKSEELTTKNKRLALKTNDLTPSSPTTRSRRLKKVENEENITPNNILTPKNKNINLETNNLTPSSPSTRSRRLKKVENEENIAPNNILSPKNKNLNLETNNLTPSSPTTRSRRLKKVENNENIAPEEEKIVPQSPKPTKTRRTRKNVEETEVPTQKVTRRGRNATKTTEETIETVPKGRTTRKRTKKDVQTTENVETIEPVAAKRPRKNEVLKLVQFDVLENEEKEEIPKNKRGGSRKKLKEETEEITSPAKPTRTRGRKAQIIEEIQTKEEPVEKKTTTRSRRGKKIEEIKDDSVVEEITKEPAKKATRNARSKKNEETVEEIKDVPTKRSTRKKIAENEEPTLEKETKTMTRRAGRQKKEVEPEKEVEETRPTRGRKQKNETKDDEIKEPEVKTRSTRGKKKNIEETIEPVRKITRSRK